MISEVSDVSERKIEERDKNQMSQMNGGQRWQSKRGKEGGTLGLCWSNTSFGRWAVVLLGHGSPGGGQKHIHFDIV